MAEVNEQFLIKIQGKNYVTYEGLLDLAHNKGLKSIEVDLLQIPNRENGMIAICKATAMTENDEIYVDLGDASPTSVKSMLVPHIIRMASTRAKARALRDLTNVGITAVEELGIDDNINTNSAKETEEDYSSQKPKKQQLDTLKKLAHNSDMKIDYSKLTRKSAGELINKLQG